MQGRFDAYAATVKAEAHPIMEALEGVTFGAEWELMERAPQGYGVAYQLADADGQVCQLWAGGRFTYPHVSAQGDGSQAVAAVLRECFPVHYVTRADPVIFESIEPGAYDVLQGIMLDVAARHRVKVGTAGDHLLTLAGRTCYLGATSSTVRGRLYDKAAELRAKLKSPEKLATVPEHFARLEAQVRPHGKAARCEAAKLEPSEFCGSARWLRDLHEAVTGAPVERVDLREPWRESDHDRAYWAMVRSYGACILEGIERAGSGAAWLDQLRYDITRSKSGACPAD